VSNSGSPVESFSTSHSSVGNSCWNGTIYFETFIETENSGCVQRFSLIPNCYEFVESQTSFTICWGVGKFIKVGKFKNVEVGHFTCDSATLRPTVCCGSEVMTYIILFTFSSCTLSNLSTNSCESARSWFFPSRPQLAIILLRVLALCQLESWAARVNPRGLRVPACVGRVR